MNVYITSSGRYLPGEPISNESMEEYLGFVRGKPSVLRKKILRSNGIKTRHYAIDKNQKTVISNTEMAAKAAQKCIEGSYVAPKKISMLSCATSQGDYVLPGFGSMVQAELRLSSVELQTSHGICSASMMALKSAYTSIKCGDNENALVVASELASRLFKASRFEALENSGKLDFNAEFLRWMLSDGAGALMLEKVPRKTCFRIDWVRCFSHADLYPVCMSVGTSGEEGQYETWQDYPTYSDAEKDGAILIRQNVRLLDRIVKLGVDGYLRLIDSGDLQVEEIDYVLCHFSSKYFKGKIFEFLEKSGSMISEEKWYTNLYERGNTGCASIFIMLDEFMRTKKLEVGQQVICMVPESGRFNTAYMKLTVVEE